MDIILDERKEWAMRTVALDRWGVYDQLERAMNDPTGATMWPPYVLGVPPDKLMLMEQMSQGMIQPPVGGGAMPASQSPATSGSTPAAQQSSPAPEMSGAGITAASAQAPKPLGTFGSVERQATIADSQQT